MPLSKQRMRDRKRRDRLLVRFDKQLRVPQTVKPVKPKPVIMVDVDGNLIPEYE